MVRYDHPDAVKLTELVQAEYVRRYATEVGDASPMDPGQFDHPNGIFFIGYVDEIPVAMGGWRRGGPRGDLDGEIKRMFVLDSHRGQGLSRQVLEELERSAARQGISRLVLETGDEQPEAISLYRSAGYVDIEPFGFYADYDDAVHLGKDL
ncbi:GNAT family N-acetyltransferase [Aeromicrobium sp.]|uniref:GNAT family N-acetyltransferase n=1 Tax=Aeromicrobium sp. TaxID=1871063 RepID=UPI0028A898FC|nr:GNAT family N-acetyltransferase [Aeromicrobium sp.]